MLIEIIMLYSVNPNIFVILNSQSSKGPTEVIRAPPNKSIDQQPSQPSSASLRRSTGFTTPDEIANVTASAEHFGFC